MKPNQKRFTRSKKKEAELLANAIVTQLEWQSRMLALKAERRVKAIITRQRNARLKQSE